MKQIDVNQKWIHYIETLMETTNSEYNKASLSIMHNALCSYTQYLIEQEEDVEYGN